MMPVASIIITVYRRTTFLRESVQSVITQSGMSRNDLEIIIISNTDISSLNLNADNVIYTEDRSVGEKLYLGINASHSELLFFLEDDDCFLPAKIETVLPFFSNERVGYVHNNALESNHILLNEKAVERIDFSWLDHQSFISFSKKFWHLSGNMSSIAVKRSALDAKAIRNIQILPDIVIFPMVLIKGMQCIHINEPLTFIRKHSDNSTSFLFKEELAALAFKEGKFWLDYFKGKSVNLEKQNRALLLKRSLALGYSSVRLNEFKVEVKDIFLLFQYEFATGFILNDIKFYVRKFLSKFESGAKVLIP